MSRCGGGGGADDEGAAARGRRLGNAPVSITRASRKPLASRYRHVTLCVCKPERWTEDTCRIPAVVEVQISIAFPPFYAAERSEL